MKNEAIRQRLNEILDRGISAYNAITEPKDCLHDALAQACDEPGWPGPSCVNFYALMHGENLSNASEWSSPIARANGMRVYALALLDTVDIDPAEFDQRLALETNRQILPLTLRAAQMNNTADACAAATDARSARSASHRAYYATGDLGRITSPIYRAARWNRRGVWYTKASCGPAAGTARETGKAIRDSDRVLTLAADIGAKILDDLRNGVLGALQQ